MEPAETLRELIPQLFMPRNMVEAGILAESFSHYARFSYWSCTLTMLFVIVLLQSFNIPGTIFLNVVMGCVYGYTEGMIIGIGSGTIGAMTAFTLSKRWGRNLISRIVTWTGSDERLAWFRKQIDTHDSFDLLSFLVFLRISPVLPNWFINVMSPHVDVEFWPLAFATCIGIAPQTFLAVHAGVMLRMFISNGQSTPLGPREWVGLLFLGIACLIPLVIKQVLTQPKQPSAAVEGQAETKKDR
ncbi:Transmembrane protein 41-like protein [Diplonema papillatum]|nr:Transmembrane protein 41-like protein [Diplonema papillatum]|eukprot:gene12279-18982_t